MRLRGRCIFALGILLAIAGCVSSRPVALAARPALDKNDVLEFSLSGSTVQIDSVRFSGDSVTGIPWHEPTLCCRRVAYVLTDISDAHIKRFPALGAVLGAALAVVLFIGVEIAVHVGGSGS